MKRNYRLLVALGSFTAVVGLADLAGFGKGYDGFAETILVAALLPFLLSERSFLRLFRVWAWISGLMCLIAIEQMFFMPRPRGLFPSPNFFGGFCAMSAFCCLFLRPRSKHPNLYLGLAALNAGAVLASQSRGSIVALAIAGVIVLPKGWRDIALMAGGLAVMLITLTGEGRGELHSDSIQHHLENWRLGLLIARTHALLGVGQGVLFNRFYSVGIDWLVKAGVLGVMTGLWTLYEALRCALSTHKTLVAILTAWIVSGLFIFDTAATDVPLLLTLAYLLKDRDVADVAVLVHHRQPFADHRMAR